MLTIQSREAVQIARVVTPAARSHDYASHYDVAPRESKPSFAIPNRDFIFRDSARWAFFCRKTTMHDEHNQPTASDEDDLYAAAPRDFPRPEHRGAVPGMQPKLLNTKYKDKVHQLGSTPPELYQQWDVCEDFAQQLADKSRDSKAGAIPASPAQNRVGV